MAFQSHLPNPEAAAANLVIGMVNIKRQRLEAATLALMDRKLRYRKNIAYAEKVALYIMGKTPEGEREGMLARAIVPLADHFLALPDDAPLPTEQEVIEYIAANGGLAQLWASSNRSRREG